VTAGEGNETEDSGEGSELRTLTVGLRAVNRMAKDDEGKLASFVSGVVAGSAAPREGVQVVYGGSSETGNTCSVVPDKSGGAGSTSEPARSGPAVSTGAHGRCASAQTSAKRTISCSMSWNGTERDANGSGSA